MSTVPVAPGQRFVLHGVDWRTYTRMLRALEERPGVRLTYDRGTLEIMTLTFGHEHRGHFLGRLVAVLTEELNLPLAGGGSTTLRRRRRRRGLEADECFWIANEALVRGKERIDLRRDPPPDLVVEVDVTHSSVTRMPIYAALRVPEIWRLASDVLTFHVLDAIGEYAIVAHSLAFPLVTAADIARFLALRGGQLDDNAVVREFRVWVQQQIAARGSAPPSP